MGDPVRATLAACLLCTVSFGSAAAHDIVGRVIGVSDGDTITLLVAREQIKIRLADIDAPESRQPFGTRSKQSLSEICYNKSATAEPVSKDRYGRTVARLVCGPTDANAEQVRRGMAWVFDRYARPDSALYALQTRARTDGRGLWSDPHPIPPWEWRARERERTQ